MAGNNSQRRDYDIAASQQVQDNFIRIASQLEALIDARDADVRAAMSDYAADGVSDDYSAKELRWRNAADEVKRIVGVIRESLERSDETAQTALNRAKAAVENIG